MTPIAAIDRARRRTRVVSPAVVDLSAARSASGSATTSSSCSSICYASDGAPRRLRRAPRSGSASWPTPFVTACASDSRGRPRPSASRQHRRRGSFMPLSPPKTSATRSRALKSNPGRRGGHRRHAGAGDRRQLGDLHRRQRGAAAAAAIRRRQSGVILLREVDPRGRDSGLSIPAFDDLRAEPDDDQRR